MATNCHPCIKETFSVGSEYDGDEQYFKQMGFPPFKVVEIINNSLVNISKYQKIRCEEENVEEELAEIEEIQRLTKPKRKERDNTFYLNLNPKDARYRQQIMKKLFSKKGIASYGTDSRFKEIARGINIDTLTDLVHLRSKMKKQYKNNSKDDILETYNSMQELYKILRNYAGEYRELAGDPSYDALLEKIKKLPNEFKGLIRNLNTADEMKLFYVDMKNSVIVPVQDNSVPRAKRIQIDNLDCMMESEIKPTKVAKKKIQEFHSRILRDLRSNVFLRAEYETDYDHPDTAVSLVADIATPTMIYDAYSHYLRSFEIAEGEGQDRKTRMLSSLKYTFPKFKNKFDIKNLFPLILKNKYDFYGGEYEACIHYAPINFQTDSDEKKVLLVGLNSGGKSVTLETLATSMLLASAGLPLPADSVVLPKWNKLTYYNNTKRSSFGKLETEMRDVSGIIKKAKRGNVIIIDNFFEGGSPQVTTHVAGKFLDELTKVDAHILVESHAPLDLDHFEEKGWTIFVPEYTEKKGWIEPTYKVSRGKPDPDVMARYAMQLARMSLNDSE